MAIKINIQQLLKYAAVISSLLLCSLHSQAQVKLGGNPRAMNPDAMLEIESNNKGLLLPRVALISLQSARPMSAFVKGMLVYNTATTEELRPGLYYCDGARWVPLIADDSNQLPVAPVRNNAGGIISQGPVLNPPLLYDPGNGNSSTSSSSTFWSLDGNSRTTTANFIGTTDNAPLRFRTNNIERLRITANGWVGIGTNNPTAALEINGQLAIDSLSTGNMATDNILVANPADGKVKKVAASNFVSGVQKKLEVVAVTGQTIFNTPSAITDINKIMLYRNGVMISFSRSGNSSIKAEIACSAGDEIRIIQLL